MDKWFMTKGLGPNIEFELMKNFLFKWKLDCCKEFFIRA